MPNRRVPAQGSSVGIFNERMNEWQQNLIDCKLMLYGTDTPPTCLDTQDSDQESDPVSENDADEGGTGGDTGSAADRAK